MYAEYVSAWRECQVPGEESSRLAASLLFEHLPDLADAGGVLWLLVRRSQGDDPREAKREPRPVPDHARGVTRAWRDLVGQDLDHDRRVEPRVGHDVRVDSG